MLRKLSIPVISGAAIACGMALDTTELPLTKILACFPGQAACAEAALARAASMSPRPTRSAPCPWRRSHATAPLSRRSARRLASSPSCPTTKTHRSSSLTVRVGRAWTAKSREPQTRRRPSTSAAASRAPSSSPSPSSSPVASARSPSSVASGPSARASPAIAYTMPTSPITPPRSTWNQGRPETPGRWLVIAEYAAPRQVDPALAEARLLDILTIAPRILDVDPENVFAKARIRSRGGSQYGKQAGGFSAASKNAKNGDAATRTRADAAPRALEPARPPPTSYTRRLPLDPGGLTFAVNFNDYLDTDFLDHRITRGLVREHARGKRFFLNRSPTPAPPPATPPGRRRRGDRHRGPLQHLLGLGRAQHGAERLCGSDDHAQAPAPTSTKLDLPPTCAPRATAGT